MKRLTRKRNSGIKTGYWSPEKKETLVQRLAEYENTGLTPEDVESVNDFEKSQIGILMKKLSEERKKHRWIPVKERLPENDDFVLVTVSGIYNHLTFSNVIELASYSKQEGWMINGYLEWEDPGVIAWMPLPEAYKEDEDDKTD